MLTPDRVRDRVLERMPRDDGLGIPGEDEVGAEGLTEAERARVDDPSVSAAERLLLARRWVSGLRAERARLRALIDALIDARARDTYRVLRRDADPRWEELSAPARERYRAQIHADLGHRS
jgi:hypothetical protein